MSTLFVSLDFFFIRILPLLLLVMLLFSRQHSYTKAVLFTFNRMMLFFGFAQLILWYNWIDFFSNQSTDANKYPVSDFQQLVIGLKLVQAIFPLFTLSKRIAGSWIFSILYWLLLCWMPIYNMVTIGQTGTRIEWMGDSMLWMAFIAFFAVLYSFFWWMKALPFQRTQDV